MQWLVFCLFTIWTVLFGAFFVLLFPESSDRIEQIFHEQQEYESVSGEDPGVVPTPPAYMNDYPEVAAPPSPVTTMTPTPTPEVKEDVVPITKGTAPVQIEIKGQNEMPKTTQELRKEIDQKLQVALENRLIRILVKMNIAACPTCTNDDKRLVLQLKMMQALLEGKPTQAFRYSEELNKYVKNQKKGMWLGNPDDKKRPRIPNPTNGKPPQR